MRSTIVFFLAAALTPACVVSSSQTSDDSSSSESAVTPKGLDLRVTRVDLVSDRPGAAHLDPNLVNPWGIAFNPSGPVWVSNNGSGKASVYDASGNLTLTVDLAGAAPTGQVFNSSSAWDGDKFIISTEGGTILGWQPAGGAQVRVDNAASGAVYKGIAHTSRLFAADFHNAKVDVFDTSYAPIALGPGAFHDPQIPAGFAPFNVVADTARLEPRIYVTYAKQDASGLDDEHGPGLGYVDAFDFNGVLQERIAAGGSLDAPWGLAVAPASWGALRGKLLVGNFGDGTIHVFDLAPPLPEQGSDEGFAHGGGIETCGFQFGQPDAPHKEPCTPGMDGFTFGPKPHAPPKDLGALTDASGAKLVIDGLWALAVAPDGRLFYSAGDDDEQHGTFGTLTPVK